MRRTTKSKSQKARKKEANVYHSIQEFEKRLLPKYHQEKLAEKKRKEPRIYGTGHATELLERIRDQVAKSH
jgi:hypothetical protein